MVNTTRAIERARTVARQRAEANMTARVAIYRLTPQDTLDPNTLVLTTNAQEIILETKAFIHTLSSSGEVTAGDGPIPLRAAIFSIPVVIPSQYKLPRIDDIVRVTSYRADPTVLGRSYQIVAVSDAGLLASTRQLTCQAWFDSDQWEQQ